MPAKVPTASDAALHFQPTRCCLIVIVGVPREIETGPDSRSDLQAAKVVLEMEILTRLYVRSDVRWFSPFLIQMRRLRTSVAFH